MREDFAIIIPSYDRVNVLLNNTLKMLNNYNYNGKIYIVVSDNDPQLNEYKKKIPEEQLFIFHKPDYYDYYDTFFNKKEFNSKLYSLAFIDDKLIDDLNFFMVIDDDINYFVNRYISNGMLKYKKINNNQFNDFLIYYINFLENTIYSCISFLGNYTLFNGIKSDIIEKGYSYNLNAIYLFKKSSKFDFCNVFNEEPSSLHLNTKYNKYEITLPYIFFDMQTSDKDINESTGRFDGGYADLQNKIGNFSYVSSLSLFMCQPNYIKKIVINPKKTICYKDSSNIYPMVVDGRWKK